MSNRDKGSNSVWWRRYTRILD